MFCMSGLNLFFKSLTCFFTHKYISVKFEIKADAKQRLFKNKLLTV